MNGKKAKAIRRMAAKALVEFRKLHDPRSKIPFNRLCRAAKKAYKRGEIEVENKSYRNARSW